MSSPLQAISWLLGAAGKEKSFRANPIIGSQRLNRMGFHRKRVELAAKMASMRRSRLASKLDSADRAAIDEQGFVIKSDYLPPETFDALRAELFGKPIAAREMRQGQTVTRMASLAAAGAQTGFSVALSPKVGDLMAYAAGRSGAPVICIQTVIANPSDPQRDQQTEMHSDTFHATAKLWLFLTDVGDEDGPFVYVPGSHKLTRERLEWEYVQSLTACDDSRLHHSLGSFRVREQELQDLGYGPPRRITVKANTLVVADTHGFHHRAASARPTTRVELYGYLRRNPFIPWNGFDVTALPGIRGRQLDFFYRYLDIRRRYFGKDSIWKDVGPVPIDSPAQI